MRNYDKSVGNKKRNTIQKAGKKCEKDGGKKMKVQRNEESKKENEDQDQLKN